MAKKVINFDFSINSLVGDKTILKGELISAEPFRIDGTFIGKINSTGKVYIGKNGTSDGILIAKNVIIGGIIKGDVYSEENVLVLKTAHVSGNIYTCSINMEDGVFFDGECRILSKENMLELIESKRSESYK
jgi:cytoskeletal protein CcmA (bactofilin family)